jgi:diaminopimelate epimerase
MLESSERHDGKSMSEIAIAKYHGLGNDFVIVDLRGAEPDPSPQAPPVAQAICDRRFGVGADGVLAILPATVAGADSRMRTINADGSEAEMCGNGIRCVAKHLHDRDPALHRPIIHIETLAGVLACRITRGPDGRASSVSVDMGRPRLTRGEIPMTGAADERCLEQDLDIEGRRFHVTAVSMGNPHAVAFVDESGSALRRLAERFGPALERHPWFLQRTNAEFARVVSPREIDLVVWERGCGITLACGTGACATAVAACITGRAAPGTDIRLRLLGGDLTITVAPDGSQVVMTGGATPIFEATINMAALLASRRPTEHTYPSLIGLDKGR